VKNRSTKEITDGVTIEMRHQREKTFFSTVSPWTELNKDRVGVRALKKFLGRLLHEHISSEFPSVVRDIAKLASSTQKELELLGPSRQTTGDQRRFLSRIATAYQQYVQNALRGNYGPDLDKGSPLKLRMHIRTLNDELAETMAREGHAKVFCMANCDIDQEFARSGDDQPDIYEWIREIYRDSRGAEPPGTVNPLVVENLFRQQSKPWQQIAEKYHDRIISTVQSFNQELLAIIVPDGDIKGKLTARLSQWEEKSRNRAREQLSRIVHDEQDGILQTVNHYYAETLATIREERVAARLREIHLDENKFDMAVVMKAVHLSNEDQVVNDIHDILKAYYKVAMKRFTDNIVLQVTERHILGRGGLVQTLCPDFIGDLPVDELNEIAAESFASSTARNELATKCDRLQKASEAAKGAVL
jgi:hypothetical protein